MDQPSFARRATLDDLAALKALWEVNRLPVEELERRLTEFQVVVRPDGVLLGAAGFQNAGSHALIHHEASYSRESAGAAQPLLWVRCQVLSRNRGVARLWRRGNDDPFWAGVGFGAPSAEELGQLPPALAGGRGTVTTLRLREEALLPDDLERQLALFVEAQREASDRLVGRARLLKWVAVLLALAVFGAAMFLLLRLQLTRRRAR